MATLSDVYQSAPPAAPAAAPSVDPGAPPPSAPAPVSTDSAAAPIEAPSGSTPPPAAAAPPPGDSAAPAPPAAPVPSTTEQQRIAAAQRMAHEKAVQAAQLREQLSAVLGHPVAGPAARAVLDGVPPPAPAAPAPRPAEAPPAPRPSAPPPADRVATASREALTRGVPAERIRAMYEDFYKAGKSDEEAFAGLVTNILGLVPEVLARDRRFLETTYDHTRTQARVEAQLDSQIKVFEDFWGQHAPGIPADYFWRHSDDAVRAHPTDQAQQAIYCMDRVQAELRPAFERRLGAVRDTTAMHQTQDALLGGGGATPTATAEAPVGGTFADTLKAQRAGIRRVGSP